MNTAMSFMDDPFVQECQTQTILRAAKATKTSTGTSKVPKNPSADR